MTFGDRASALKDQKRLSQKDIAKTVGIGPVILSRYFNNQNVPSVVVAGKIAQALGTSLDYLQFGVMQDENSMVSVNLKLQQFDKLPQPDQDCVLAVLEAFIAKGKLQDILGK